VRPGRVNGGDEGIGRLAAEGRGPVRPDDDGIGDANPEAPEALCRVLDMPERGIGLLLHRPDAEIKPCLRENAGHPLALATSAPTAIKWHDEWRAHRAAREGLCATNASPWLSM
jgi:hypothetical protein